MELFEAQVKLLERDGHRESSKFLQSFNSAVLVTTNLQTEINRRTVALYNDFRNCLSEISVEMADLCKTLSALDSACVKATGSRVGSHDDTQLTAHTLNDQIQKTLVALEQSSAEVAELQKGFEKKKGYARDRLLELQKSQASRKRRLHEAFGSKLDAAVKKLKRFRSELEETFTCEEVSTSLALDTERRATGKSHTKCTRDYRNTERKFERKEAFRRKRLAAIHQALDTLEAELEASRPPGTEDTCDTFTAPAVSSTSTATDAELMSAEPGDDQDRRESESQ